MKKLYVLLLLAFLAAPLFTQNISALERQIVMAGSEEMLRLINDRTLEKELHSIFSHFQEDEREVISDYMAVFPGINILESFFIILKVGIVAALGSGDENYIEAALDAFDYFDEFDSIEDFSDIPNEMLEALESPYWQDLYGFYRIFDLDAFIKKRYPEFYY